MKSINKGVGVPPMGPNMEVKDKEVSMSPSEPLIIPLFPKSLIPLALYTIYTICK